MLYRNKFLDIDKNLLDKYARILHAPVETYFCDTALHRVFGVDVTEDVDLENFSAVDIEEAVLSCMKEDILAVELRRRLTK